MNPMVHFDNVHQGLITMRRFVDTAQKRGFELYLTGSRFFGTATKGSDWDFMLQDEENLTHESFLKEMGFKPEDGGRYPDLLTTEVWWCDELRAHVQIVKDVRVKLLAQEAIKRTNALAITESYTTRDSFGKRTMRRLVWDLAIEAVLG